MWQWLAVGARSQTVLSPGRAPSGFPTRRVTHRRTRSLAQRRRMQDFPSPRAQGAQFPSALPYAVGGKKLLCPFHPLVLGSTKQLLGLAHPAGRRKQGLGSSFVLSLKCWVLCGPGCPMMGRPAAMCHQGCIHCAHWLLGHNCLPTAPRPWRWLQSSRSGVELQMVIYPSPPAPRKGSCSTFVPWQSSPKRMSALGHPCQWWCLGEIPSVVPKTSECFGPPAPVVPIGSFGAPHPSSPNE